MYRSAKSNLQCSVSVRFLAVSSLSRELLPLTSLIRVTCHAQPHQRNLQFPVSAVTSHWQMIKIRYSLICSRSGNLSQKLWNPFQVKQEKKYYSDDEQYCLYITVYIKLKLFFSWAKKLWVKNFPWWLIGRN